MARISVAVALLLAGIVLMLVTPGVRQAATASGSRTRALSPDLAADKQAIPVLNRAASRVALRLAGARAAMQRLTDARNASQLAAFHAAYGPARDAAYTQAYRTAFPVALANSSWYVVHVTKTGGFKATSWTAPQGQEYVIDGGSVTAYAPGTAPSPYLAPAPAPTDVQGDGTYPGPGDVPGYYNSDGNWVPSPSPDPNLTPAGPTATCADGTYSYSQHASGTCSHHGGVSSWGG
jgi:hypothetical protein